jgi:adenine-specific DNA-methyltransferase
VSEEMGEVHCLAPIIYERKNAIVLDYFAGSGTTGHAVMMLNKEDKGNRKFILCTNNENGIAEDVCYPRIKNAIKGHTNYKDITNIPTNLKYFKTDFVNAESTDQNKKKLVDKSTEMLCLKEDCFKSIKNSSNFKIFKDSKNKYLGIIYDDAGITPFKNEAKKISKKIIVYVFSLDDSAREEEFEDIKDLVELKPIPTVILNVYKRIFK